MYFSDVVCPISMQYTAHGGWSSSCLIYSKGSFVITKHGFYCWVDRTASVVIFVLLHDTDHGFLYISRAMPTSPACLDQWEGGTTLYLCVLVGIGIHYIYAHIYTHRNACSPALHRGTCITSVLLKWSKLSPLLTLILWKRSCLITLLFCNELNV